jgi:group II intron reverse transcriptase/maturase/CRISPR-associated endonuclease Cas1
MGDKEKTAESGRPADSEAEPAKSGHTVASAGGATIFRTATRFVTLAEAWERVRANNGAAGGDGVPIARFAPLAITHLSRLSHALRNGSYRPGPVRRVFIKKDDGGLRPLDIPCVIDRIAQSAVALTLGPVLDKEMHEGSYAYRPGRSVAQAVQRVSSLRRDGFRYVVDGDIVRYFERIPHERLIARLERAVDDAPLTDLVALWLEAYAPHGLGVPQGSPLSPLLANLYLDDVDEAIEGRGVRLVRFADDFVLLCKTEGAAAGALVRMRDLLAGHGLELHAEKTRIVPFEQGFRFLGHIFVRGMVWKDLSDDPAPSEDLIVSAEQALAAAGIRQDEREAEDDGQRSAHARRQRVLYLVEPGRMLGADGAHFAVRHAGETVLDEPATRLNRIEIGPECGLDIAALDLAAAHDVTVVRVSGHGRSIGAWTAMGSSRARLHLAQAGLVLDAGRRVELARTIVAGRVANQRILLKRLDRGRNDPEIDPVVVKLDRIRRKLAQENMEVNEAMGHEGHATALYWRALARHVDKPWAFKGQRRRRTGADPFNAALDLLCSVLARDVRIAAERMGLHTGFGALHATDDGEDALVYDLMEELRAPVAEACTAALFGRRALREAHFIARPGGGVRLDRTGYAACIRGYEAWVARAVRSRTGRRTSWRGIMEDQAHAYAAHCEGEETYAPYLMDY